MASIAFEEYKNKLNNLRPALDDLGGALHLDEARNEVEKLEEESAQDGFWNDTENSQRVQKRIKTLKHKLERYAKLTGAWEDMLTMCEMAVEEDDDSMLPDLENEFQSFEETLESMRLETLLTGEYDANNAILTFHAGAGGTEAQDWTSMLYRMYNMWAERHGYTVKLMDYLDGDEAGIKSATIMIEGENAYGFLKSENGIHRLVRISPFDASGRRHTSFAAVEVMPEITEDSEIELRDEDIKMDVYRSSGAGGQKVNKTSSAVRLTHIPTGIVVSSQVERSHFQNLENCKNMLRARLAEIKEREHLEKISDIKGVQLKIEWGSQIRSYVFMPYTLAKDHRTGYENGNIQAVMDGDIDGFINAYLSMNADKEKEITDAKRRSLFGCGAFLSWDEADDLLVIHALVAGRGHIAAERAVDIPEPVAFEEQGLHAGVDLRRLAAKLQHGAPVVPLAAHGGSRGGDGGLRRRVAAADVVIIGVCAAVRPEGGIVGRVAHGHALGREGEPRVAEVARQRRLALVVLQVPGGVEVIDRAVELRRDPGVAVSRAVGRQGRARDDARRNAAALEQVDIGIGDAAADGLPLADSGVSRLVIRLARDVAHVLQQPVVEIQRAGIVPRRSGGEQAVRRPGELLAARRAVVGIDPVERDGDVRVQPAVDRVPVGAHPELRVVEQLGHAGLERVGVAVVDRGVRLAAHRRVQHGGHARVGGAVRRRVRQDGRLHLDLHGGHRREPGVHTRIKQHARQNENKYQQTQGAPAAAAARRRLCCTQPLRVDVIVIGHKVSLPRGSLKDCQLFSAVNGGNRKKFLL